MVLKVRRGGVLFLVGREGREKKIDDYGVGGQSICDMR
jgi:hypothetical protein